MEAYLRNVKLFISFFVLIAAYAQVSMGARYGMGDMAKSLDGVHWLDEKPFEGFQDGRIYVVELWATWCPSCETGVKKLVEIQNRYHNAGVTVVALATYEQESNPNAQRDSVKKFLSLHTPDRNFVAGFDPDNVIRREWYESAEPAGIPVVFIIDRIGKVAFVGSMEKLEGALNSIIDGTLTEGSPQWTQYVNDMRREKLAQELKGSLYNLEREERWSEVLVKAREGLAIGANTHDFIAAEVNALLRLERTEDVVIAYAEYLERYRDDLGVIYLAFGNLFPNPQWGKIMPKSMSLRFRLAIGRPWASALERLIPWPPVEDHMGIYITLGEYYYLSGNREKALEITSHFLELIEKMDKSSFDYKAFSGFVSQAHERFSKPLPSEQDRTCMAVFGKF